LNPTTPSNYLEYLEQRKIPILYGYRPYFVLVNNLVEASFNTPPPQKKEETRGGTFLTGREFNLGKMKSLNRSFRIRA
jgi:hypothetical protein